MVCACLAEKGAKQLLLAHLSKENNLPGLARETVSRRLCGEIRIQVAPRSERSEELEI